MNTARRHWYRARPMVAYVTLVAVMAIAFFLYNRHTLSHIHADQQADCARAQRLAKNQRVVLRTLIDDRADKPGFLLHTRPAVRKRSITELRAALAAVPRFAGC